MKFLSIILLISTATAVLAQNQILIPAGQQLKLDADTTLLVDGHLRINNGFVKFNNYRFLTLQNVSSSNLNTFVGPNSGNLTMTGTFNSYFGENSGKATTTGGNNSFFGTNSGFSNTSGLANTFLGYKSGYKNVGGNLNVFVGSTSGNWNISGSSNTFVGQDAGNLNSSGSFNTYLGQDAGVDNTAGNNNTGLGYSAGAGNTGSGNVFLGYNAGASSSSVSNRLIITNGETTPLISGTFATTSPSVAGKISINGKTSIGTAATPSSVTVTGSGAGTYNTTGFNLFVRGGIVTESLHVTPFSNWADYVFQKDYALKTLPEVEAFIRKNNHLPNIPSAKEIAKNGINMGEMSRLQQEKIEELTLYLIDLNKQVTELKKVVAELTQIKN